MKISPPPPPLLTPLMSQASSSQKLPGPDSAEWHLVNEQRLIAIKLQGKGSDSNSHVIDMCNDVSLWTLSLLHATVKFEISFSSNSQ
jgi:hypothetical protein